MGAILKDGSVFLHVPKTGGNWIIEILKIHKILEREFFHKHSDAGRLQVLEDEIFLKNPFIFCFVRHPVTWFESWYRYQKKRKFKGWGKNGNVFYHPCSVIDDCQNDDFNKFVTNVIDKCPGFVSHMFFQFTKNSDFVGHQEKLFHHSKILLEGLNKDYNFNVSARLESINVSINYPIRWDRKVLNEFQKYELSGIKQYGYKPII